MPAQRASRSEQILLFGRNFIKHPKMLGSLIPSSRFLVNKVLSEVDWARARVFLEYGPGVGTFTTEILRRMRPDAVLIALETNADFVRFLRGKIHDDRLHVVHGSAADADAALARLNLRHADYVISGIPYTTMPPEVRETILRKTHHAPTPDRCVPGVPVHPHRAAVPPAGLRPGASGLRAAERDAGPPVLLPASR